MIRLRHKLLIHFLHLLDQAVTIICLGFFANAYVDRYWSTDALAVLILLVGSIFFFNQFVRYEPNRFTGFGSQLVGLLKAITATTFLLLAVSVLFRFPVVGPADILVFWAVVTVLLAACRLMVQQALRYSRSSGITGRQLLIVGCNARAQRLAARFDTFP